jgi:hypothetical protein
MYENAMTDHIDLEELAEYLDSDLSPDDGSVWRTNGSEKTKIRKGARNRRDR